MNAGGSVEYLFDLRWMIQYVGRAPRAGFWTWPGNGPEGRASMQPKDGILSVLIEAKNRATREIKSLAAVDGPDWAEVRWIAHAPIRPGTHEGKIQGMTLVSRYHKIHVYVDGSVRVEGR